MVVMDAETSECKNWLLMSMEFGKDCWGVCSALHRSCTCFVQMVMRLRKALLLKWCQKYAFPGHHGTNEFPRTCVPINTNFLCERF